MFYDMKPLYTLPGSVFEIEKYKQRLIIKKAPELCEFRGFPPCKM